MKKFYLLMVALICAMTANADTYVNIPGDHNGWGDNGVQPVNGISTHRSLKIGTGGFKVKVWDGSEHWYSTGGSIPQSEWVYIASNNNNNMTIQGASNDQYFDVQWDNENKKIYVTPSKMRYVMHGELNGNGWQDMDLEEVDGLWVSRNHYFQTGYFGIKQVAPSGAQTAWISADGSADVTIGEAKKVKKDGTNLKLNEAGTYDFVFDPANMTVRFGIPYEPVAMRLVNHRPFEKEPKTIDMEYVDGKYTVTVDELAHEFYFEAEGVKYGADPDDANHNWRAFDESGNAKAPANACAISENEETPFLSDHYVTIDLQNGNNLVEDSELRFSTHTADKMAYHSNVTLSLPVDSEGKISTMAVASEKVVTGVGNILAGSDTAPVEYFNLQGVRIANPAPGQVVIVRRGTNVTKQLVR